MFFDSELCLTKVPGSTSRDNALALSSALVLCEPVDMSVLLSAGGETDQRRIAIDFTVMETGVGPGAIYLLLETDHTPEMPSPYVIYTTGVGVDPNALIEGMRTKEVGEVFSATTGFPYDIPMEHMRRWLRLSLFHTNTCTAGKIFAAVAVDQHTDFNDLGL